MDYARNYLNATKIADSIREQASRGKVRRASGLAARKEKIQEATQESLSIERYLKDIREMFDVPERERLEYGGMSNRALSVVESDLAPETSPRPVTALEGLAGESNLDEDPDFMAAIEKLEAKYPGLERREIFRIIQGESGFNPQAVNEDTSAAGLFQFTPDAASDLGYTTEEILSMSPAEQVEVYDEYLSRWDYNPENSLGIMQAAPAYAKTRGGDDVVYEKGSKAWEQNPGWRSEGDGPITVASINRYYRGL